VAGATNPVAGPYVNWSAPEPTGVVALLAPAGAPLLGLVSVLAPALATGCTAVLVADERAPLPALTLAEVLATSDVPPGVVNLLSGRAAELGPPLAAHRDVNALDLAGVAEDPELARELEIAAADTVKRVLRPRRADRGPYDWYADPGTGRLTAFLETKTVWHPAGTTSGAGSGY
jgi:acyl-CoA reductase-like NAD-dependent aldehyde dehydrogenase